MGETAQQTIEGCIVRKETALYLVPATGDATLISSSGKDVSSNVGQQVRLTGTKGHGKHRDSEASSQTGAAGTAGAAEAGQFVVHRVDVVAQACPAEIQNRIDQSSGGQTPK